MTEAESLLHLTGYMDISTGNKHGWQPNEEDTGARAWAGQG